MYFRYYVYLFKLIYLYCTFISIQTGTFREVWHTPLCTNRLATPVNNMNVVMEVALSVSRMHAKLPNDDRYQVARCKRKHAAEPARYGGPQVDARILEAPYAHSGASVFLVTDEQVNERERVQSDRLLNAMPRVVLVIHLNYLQL